MEREVLVTGIGGQGVQLATQVLARAAIADGREVQLFGSYGGMMRGGNTDTTLVVADAAIESPPTVGRAWSAIIMHGEFAAPVLSRVQSDGIVLVNTSIVTTSDLPAMPSSVGVVELPVTDVAIDLGAIVMASMVMLGAFAVATRLVPFEALIDAVPDAIPAYRGHHVAGSQAAIAAGAALVPDIVTPAWAGTSPSPARSVRA